MDQVQRLAQECRRLNGELAKRDARLADLRDRLRANASPKARRKSELQRENEWLRKRLIQAYSFLGSEIENLPSDILGREG